MYKKLCRKWMLDRNFKKCHIPYISIIYIVIYIILLIVYYSPKQTDNKNEVIYNQCMNGVTNKDKDCEIFASYFTEGKEYLGLLYNYFGIFDWNLGIPIRLWQIVTFLVVFTFIETFYGSLFLFIILLANIYAVNSMVMDNCYNMSNFMLYWPKCCGSHLQVLITGAFFSCVIFWAKNKYVKIFFTIALIGFAIGMYLFDTYQFDEDEKCNIMLGHISWVLFGMSFASILTLLLFPHIHHKRSVQLFAGISIVATLLFMGSGIKFGYERENKSVTE